jgi:hypothetical protein
MTMTKEVKEHSLREWIAKNIREIEIVLLTDIGATNIKEWDNIAPTGKDYYFAEADRFIAELKRRMQATALTPEQVQKITGHTGTDLNDESDVDLRFALTMAAAQLNATLEALK